MVDQTIQHTAMLLALGMPEYWKAELTNQWYFDADHWLCDQGIPTPGQRRTIINAYVTWCYAEKVKRWRADGITPFEVTTVVKEDRHG